MPVGDEFWRSLISDNGPWAGLVFYLLYRDYQKDQAVRDALSKNTGVLIEMATLIRERLRRAPEGGA